MVCLESGVVDVLQLYYNMIDLTCGRELFSVAHSQGVGIVVKAPLARGLLSGKYNQGYDFEEPDFRRKWEDEGRLGVIMERAKLLRGRLGRREESLAQTALRFVLSREEVSTVIPGAKTPDQAEQNITASELGPLSKDDIVVIEKLFGGEERINWS